MSRYRTATRRRRQAVEGENRDRWLVSYADFITLLFAFFTVMYALSTINEGKYKAMSESLSEAFGPAGTTGVGKMVDPGIAEEAIAPEYMIQAFKKTFTRDYRRVQSTLTGLETKGKITINPESRGVVISLNESGVFASGSAELLPGALGAIKEITLILIDMPNQIRIEGHTDDIPISTPEFPSNWELSSARAMNILRYMTEEVGMDTRRLSATGYGEHRGVASNDSEEGRAKNRRIDIVILNKDGSLLEPQTP